LSILNIKENIIRNKTKQLKKQLSDGYLDAKQPIRRIAILNNPVSKLTYDRLKYIEKITGLDTRNFDILTVKGRNDNYNELRGVIATKSDFSVFGKITSTEILEFLDRNYDLLVDFTGIQNEIELYFSLAIKSKFRVGYFLDDNIYDLMLDVKHGDIKAYTDELIRYLRILEYL